MSDVRKEVDGKKGRFVVEIDGHKAEMTFSVMSAASIIVDHTGVPDAIRGTGAGRILVEALVADARAEGYKIVPLCPFVNRERAKHPEWADVFNV